METFGWILVFLVIVLMVGGVLWFVLRKEYDFKIFDIEFSFMKSALWANPNFNKDILKKYLTEQFNERGWMEHIKYFKGVKVKFTGDFPIKLPHTNDQYCAAYYSPDFHQCVVGVSQEPTETPTGKKYQPLDRPERTALVHELEHHFDYMHTGDPDGDHDYRYTPGDPNTNPNKDDD